MRGAEQNLSYHAMTMLEVERRLKKRHKLASKLRNGKSKTRALYRATDPGENIFAKARARQKVPLHYCAKGLALSERRMHTLT